MKKIILSICAAAAISALAADNNAYEFYIQKADGNILTIQNSAVDHIEFAKSDGSDNWDSHLIVFKDGTKTSIPFADVTEVVLTDFITDADSVVDLGLSTLWATANIGALSSADYGDLVGWGDPSGAHKEQYHTSSYGSYLANKNTCLGFYGGVEPPEQISGTDLDVARAKLGPDWALPTLKEMNELIEKCKWQWMEYRGAQGVRVTGPSGASLFLPAGGMRRGNNMTSQINDFGGYWTGDWYGTSSSTSSTKGEMSYALSFGITAGGFYKINPYYRYSGCSVRPVCKK